MQAETKNCQNCKIGFQIEPDDFGFYEKMEVAPPTFCPDCRRQRRFAWRNFMNLHRTTCALTGVPVITIYPPELNMPVYTPQAWHGDGWNARDFAQEYDFSRPFFSQYNDLIRKVPKPAMDNDDSLRSTNCMYTNDFIQGKDCYLVVKAWKVENCMYSFYIVSSKDLVDAYNSFGKDEGNYETVNTEHCYHSRYIYDCRSCSDSAFSYDCRNCDNVFMCTGLRGKSYCFKNEEVGKERYDKIMEEYALHTYGGVRRASEEFAPLMLAHPRKALRMINCVDSLGDLIINSKNCKYCFTALASENYKYGSFSDGVKDAYDAEACGGSELAYECDLTTSCSNIIGCFWTLYSQDVAYMRYCYRTKNCFGCVGLKDAEYCILNKQYTKEEYERMVPEIKKHMASMPYNDSKGSQYSYGDFLPIELSYFPYNGSAAEWIFPLSEKEIEENGFYYLPQVAEKQDGEVVLASALPDSIDDVSDDILTKVIVSKNSDKRYKITAQELEFYRKYKIPLPRESFFERHAKRQKMATSYHLYDRTSDKSGVPIITSYPPGSPEKVWSNEEYKAEFE